MGLFTGVGFLIHAVAMKSKKMYVIAGAWILASALYFGLSSVIDTGTKGNPAETLESNLLTGYTFVIFLGGITHSVISNRSWLRWKAHNTGTAAPWYAGSDLANGSSKPDIQKESSANALSALVGSGVGSSTDLGTTIDVNSASLDDLISQGFDAPSASKILQEKSKSGPFLNQNDLLQRSGIAPHVVLTAGNQLTYGSTVEPPATPNLPTDNSQPPKRRRLDF